MRSPSYMLRNGPFSRGRWKPNLGSEGFSVAEASRRRRVCQLRSVMLAGPQILPVIQADVTEREA